MITCECCGMVFREENHEEFSVHNTVAHLHEYLGTYAYQYNPIPYIRHTEKRLNELFIEKEAREAIERLYKN